MSPEKRSKLMSRIRGSNTGPERYLFALFDAGGLEFRTHVRDLAGRPDFVFDSDQLAVFVDGDFWHGWRFPVWNTKLSPRWREKIESNRKRDSSQRRRLRYRHWKVLRIWEHQIEEDCLACVRRVARRLETQSPDWTAIEKYFSTLPKLKRRNRLPRVSRSIVWNE